jgi:flagellar biosynthesis chaperone FliJ
MRTALRIGIAGALFALSAGVPWALHHHARLELQSRRDALQAQADRLSLLVEENGRLSNLLTQAKASPPLTGEQLRELLRLRNEKRRLAEQTNLLARSQGENSQLSPDELRTALSAEMIEAMKRVLAALEPALQKYALAHSNHPPGSLFDLQDYFPTDAGRKMTGLLTFEFVRDDAPRPGDVLVLRGGMPGDGTPARIYGFSDGHVVEVASEDGYFDNWEAQHMGSPPADTEEKLYLEAKGTEQERGRIKELLASVESSRAHITELAASVGISTEDASRFFDQFMQQEEVRFHRLAEMQEHLTGSPEEKWTQTRAAVKEELTKLATAMLGDKGPALAQKMAEGK